MRLKTQKGRVTILVLFYAPATCEGVDLAWTYNAHPSLAGRDSIGAPHADALPT